MPRRNGTSTNIWWARMANSRACFPAGWRPMRLIWSRRSKRRWRNSLAAALILLAGAAAAEDIPVAAIGDQPIEVTGAEGSGTLLVFSSRPLLARMPAITRLLVMIHGVRRDGDQALARGLRAIGGGGGAEPG